MKKQAIAPEIAYEIVTKEVLAQLAPGARVQHNIMVPTRDGKGERQIDVLIEGRVAGLTLNIAVDCKHYGRTLHVGAVDAFIGLIEDIQCSKGVLVGLNGFGEGAIRRAVEYGPRLQLAQVFSAEHAEFSVPVPLRMAIMEATNCQAKGSLVNGPIAHKGIFSKNAEQWKCRSPIIGEFMVMERAKAVVLESGDWFSDVDKLTFDEPGLEMLTSAGWENLASVSIEIKCEKRFKGMRIPFVEGVALVDSTGKLLAQDGLVSKWVDTVNDAEWLDMSAEEVKKWRAGEFE